MMTRIKMSLQVLVSKIGVQPSIERLILRLVRAVCSMFQVRMAFSGNSEDDHSYWTVSKIY